MIPGMDPGGALAAADPRRNQQVATPGQIACGTPDDDASVLDEDTPVPRDDVSAPSGVVSVAENNVPALLVSSAPLSVSSQSQVMASQP